MLLSIIQCVDGLAFTCKFSMSIPLSIPMRSYEHFVKPNRWQLKECKPLPLPLPSVVPETEQYCGPCVIPGTDSGIKLSRWLNSLLDEYTIKWQWLDEGAFQFVELGLEPVHCIFS